MGHAPAPATASPPPIANTREIKALPKKNRVITATPAVCTKNDANPAIASTATAIPPNAAIPEGFIPRAEEIAQTEHPAASITVLKTPPITSVPKPAVPTIASVDPSPSETNVSATQLPPLHPEEHEAVVEATPAVGNDLSVASSSAATAVPSDVNVASSSSALAEPHDPAVQNILAAAAGMSQEEQDALYANLLGMLVSGQAGLSGETATNQTSMQNGGPGTVMDSDLSGRTAHRANARAKESDDWLKLTVCRWQGPNEVRNCGATFPLCDLGTTLYLAHLIRAHDYVPHPKPINRAGPKPKIICGWESRARDGSVRVCGLDLLEESLDRHLKASTWGHILAVDPQATEAQYEVAGRRCPICQSGHVAKKCPPKAKGKSKAV